MKWLAVLLAFAAVPTWAADTEFFLQTTSTYMNGGEVVSDARKVLFALYPSRPCDLPLADAAKFRRFEVPMLLAQDAGSEFGQGCWFHAYPDKIVLIYKAGHQDVESDFGFYRVTSKTGALPAKVVAPMNPKMPFVTN